ncbi:hypothetical protein IB265_27675 [Ensifer sp. ENS10]|nr:hypothetical protein [Ensifer sp. ENS10]
MLFNIEFDHGDVLEGYVIPDGFSDVSQIAVFDRDDNLGVFPCDQLRPAVVSSGRHETGRVGFRLDSDKIPHLGYRSRLSIREAKTGVLVYRRAQIDSPVQKKVFRLETQLFPMRKFDESCGDFFQYRLDSIERFGHETSQQAFHMTFMESVYLSGRLLMKNYENYLANGFQGVVLLHNPYYEMGLRIFLLKRMATMALPFLGPRDQMILKPAAEYFADANLEDADALKRLLKRAPGKVTGVLRSPMTRQFAATSFEQTVTRRDAAPAIDLLSRFSVIGHVDDLIAFQRTLSSVLEIPVSDEVLPARHAQLDRLASTLSTLNIAELLLEEDLIFDHYVRRAIKFAALSTQDTHAKSKEN